MTDYSVPVEETEKHQKWTGFFLVDIRIIFIITYVYIIIIIIITIANLICMSIMVS